MSDIQLELLGDVAGVAVHGIDLNAPLAPTAKSMINRAFLDHHVVVFRRQRLDDDAQYRFSREFGEIESHVVRDRDGKPAPVVQEVTNLGPDGVPTERPEELGNFFWHSDKSYHAKPSRATILYAKQLPPQGGDTQFANTERGYAALSSAQQVALANVSVVHSWEANRRNTGNRPASDIEKAERPPVTHPLVRTHPDTGRKSLYLGSHTSHIVGKSISESRALLDRLLEHTTQPELIYTHCWQPGDVVMWDNRCLLHRALRNYDMARYPRVLIRTVIKGEAPF
ncbi:MAG: TauD/TfdA family dioxygenase [Pseudomonadota bacterium]